jgi:membrane fusion protein, copper/silver efflux system
MLKKYLDKLKSYAQNWKPLAQALWMKLMHFYRHVEEQFKRYWAQPRFRLCSYLLLALIVGVNIGRLFTPAAVDTSATKKVIDVEKNGIINIDLPGVTLSPETFEYIKTAEGVAPVYLSVPGRLAFNAERLKVISARAPGRVERIYAFDGAIVKTGQALADYFSPDYVSAQTEYILSSKIKSAACTRMLNQPRKRPQIICAYLVRVMKTLRGFVMVVKPLQHSLFVLRLMGL